MDVSGWRDFAPVLTLKHAQSIDAIYVSYDKQL